MQTQTKFEDGTLYVSKIYKAKKEDVFDAWVNVSKIKDWWGCAECTNVRSEVELKVGGQYSHHMKIEGVEGEVPGAATLVEYDPPHKLAYTSSDTEDKMVVSVHFTEVDEGTRVELWHSNIPDMVVDGGIKLAVIIQGGWSAAFGKLEKLFKA